MGKENIRCSSSSSNLYTLDTHELIKTKSLTYKSDHYTVKLLIGEHPE